MAVFLHVGCGSKLKEQTTQAFAGENWHEVRFDINPNVKPDIVGTMLDMSAVADGSMDALFSHHNIEHLYPHEVPLALAEFRRVLKPDGFAVIACPDLQSVCAMIAAGKLFETAYESYAGPIAPIDILYGHRPQLAAGNLYMAHRCGFTESVLSGALYESNFTIVATARLGHPKYEVWALASVQPMNETTLRQLAREHFPQ